MRLVNHPGVRVKEPGLAVNGGPARPTTKVEVAFGTDPLDPAPVFTDVTDWFLGRVRAHTGRQNEADTFQRGGLSLLLDNTDRRFDPRFGGYEGVVAGLGPVAHWRLADLTDVVGGFTLTSTAVVFQAGQVGGGASFDGSTSYLETTAFTPAMTGPTSIAVLVQGDAFTGTPRRAFTKGAAAQLDWGVAVSTAGLAQIFFNDAGGTQRTTQGTTVLDNGWHLIGGEWDPDAEALTVYVDGAAEKSNQFPGSVPRDTGDVVRIGRAATAVQHWDGMLDEASVHSRVLGADGWARLFQAATTVKDGFWPNVVKGRRVRVAESFNGVDYPVFDGFAERWPQEWSHPEESVVPLSAVDGFWPLSLTDLAATAHEQETRHQGASHWWGLGEAGAAAFDSLGNADGSYLGGITQEAESALPTDPDGKAVSWSNSDVLSPARPRVEVPGLFLQGQWTAAMWVRLTDAGANFPLFSHWDGSRWTNAWLGNGIPRLIHWPDPSTALSMQASATPMAGTAQSHHVVMLYDGTTIKAYVDGVLHVETPVSTPITSHSLTGPPTLVVGANPLINVPPLSAGRLDELALFDRALTEGEIAALHDAGRDAFAGDTSGGRIERVLDWARWPAALRDVDPGRSTVQAYAGGGNALSHIKKVEETEGGTAKFFMSYDGRATFHDRWRAITAPGSTSLATFGDSDAEPHHYTALAPSGDKPIRNYVVYSSQGQLRQVALDQDSIDRHFMHRYERSGLLTEDPAELRSGAELTLSLYKDDDWRFESMVLEPYGAESDLYPWILGLRVGDRITVVARPPGGGVEQVDMTVEARTYERDGMSVRASLSLSPAPPEFFIWGEGSGWGSRWAY